MPHLVVKKEVKTCIICLQLYNSFKDNFDLNTCSPDCYAKRANTLLLETQLLVEKIDYLTK